MSKGKTWAKGYRAFNHKDGKGCPNGRAKCWLCTKAEAVAYKAAAKSPLSDSWV